MADTVGTLEVDARSGKGTVLESITAPETKLASYNLAGKKDAMRQNSVAVNSFS